MVSNIPHGEIFLHPEGQPRKALRLRWDGKSEGRALPAGRYTLTGSRRVVTAKDGAPWIWSTTSPGIRTVTVEAGKTLRLDAAETLVTRGRTFTVKGSRRVGFSFFSEKKLGNTIYRNGRRIAIRWTALDGSGKVLADGAMAYG